MAKSMVSTICHFVLCLTVVSASVLPTNNVGFEDELAASIKELNDAIHDSTLEPINTDSVDDSVPKVNIKPVPKSDVVHIDESLPESEIIVNTDSIDHPVVPRLEKINTESVTEPDIINADDSLDDSLQGSLSRSVQEQDSDTAQPKSIRDSDSNLDTIVSDLGSQSDETVQPKQVHISLPDDVQTDFDEASTLALDTAPIPDQNDQDQDPLPDNIDTLLIDSDLNLLPAPGLDTAPVKPDPVLNAIPDLNDARSDSKPVGIEFQCLTADGNQPNWHDDTCRSYIVCRDFVPALHSCPRGQAFGLLEGGCTTRSIFGCDTENRAFKLADQAMSFIRGTWNKVSSLRVKRSTTSKSHRLVDENDSITIPLPHPLCQLFSEDVEYLHFLESSINKMLLAKGDIGIPPISLYCDDVDVYGVNDEIDNGSIDENGDNDNDKEEEQVDDGKTRKQ